MDQIRIFDMTVHGLGTAETVQVTAVDYRPKYREWLEQLNTFRFDLAHAPRFEQKLDILREQRRLQNLIASEPVTRTKVIRRKFHGWVSEFPEIIAVLSRKGYVDTTPMILAKCEQAHADPEQGNLKFSEARYSLMWKTKFFRKTTAVLFLVGNFLPDELRKVIPFMLMDGIYVQIMHGPTRQARTFAPIRDRQPEPDLKEGEKRPPIDVSPTYRTVNEIADFIGQCKVDDENRTVLQEQAVAMSQTLEALGFSTTSKGPLTKARRLKDQLPDYNAVRLTVENLAPLYDIDIPSELKPLKEYEPKRRWNTPARDRNDFDKVMAQDVKFYNERYLPSSPEVDIRLEDTTETYLVYAQIKWYLEHRIKPVYLWADAPETARFHEDTADEDDYSGNEAPSKVRRARVDVAQVRPVRLTVAECRARGIKGRMVQ